MPKLHKRMCFPIFPDPRRLAKMAIALGVQEPMCRASRPARRFPNQHRDKIGSTKSNERIHGGIKRPINVVGVFPKDEAVIRCVGAVLMKRHDEGAVHRALYMTSPGIAPVSDNPLGAIASDRCAQPGSPGSRQIVQNQADSRGGLKIANTSKPPGNRSSSRPDR